MLSRHSEVVVWTAQQQQLAKRDHGEDEHMILVLRPSDLNRDGAGWASTEGGCAPVIAAVTGDDCGRCGGAMSAPCWCDTASASRCNWSPSAERAGAARASA